MTSITKKNCADLQCKTFSQKIHKVLAAEMMEYITTMTCH